jgi:hypothetical protein
MLFAALHESVSGRSRQAAFFGPTVANGALQTLLDLVLGPVKSLMTQLRHRFWTKLRSSAGGRRTPNHSCYWTMSCASLK